MKWVMKDCPKCGEKMVLLMANLSFRPKLPFNLHCEKCKHILKYDMQKFSAEANSFANPDVADLLAQVLR